MTTITKEKRPESAHGGATNGSPAKATSANWQVVLLPVAQIGPNPFQPRTSFDAAEMEELVESVRAHGVLQPVTIRTAKADGKEEQGKSNAANGHTNGQKNGALRYHLVTGERRLRACKQAGRKTIPAIIRDDLSDVAAAELALVENVQRSNLSIMDEATGYKRLMVHFRMKEERIAKKVGKSVATIRDTMKLLNLPEPVQKLLSNKSLTPSHGQQLLHLAPFEPVCVLVAQKAVKDKLTATSLSTTLLPNVQELKQKGLVVELDYKTQFDWKEQCGSCPHKAYVQSGYSSYCLKPLEWKQKNETARELKQQEATRVMEEARQEGRHAVETDKLPPGSYRDLTFAALPAGCTGACPCRGETTDPRDATRKLPVCLDPKRFSELVQAERQAHEEARQRRFTALWREAKAVLVTEAESGTWTKTSLLLTRSLLFGHAYHYGNPDVWVMLVRQVGRELDLTLPWEKLFDAETDDAETLSLLQTVEPSRLLLLVGCLMLAQEAQEAIRFANATPDLDLVLDRTTANQPELQEEPEASSGQASMDNAPPPDADPLATEALSEPWDEETDETEWEDPWDGQETDSDEMDNRDEPQGLSGTPSPAAAADAPAAP